MYRQFLTPGLPCFFVVGSGFRMALACPRELPVDGSRNVGLTGIIKLPILGESNNVW